VYRATGPRLLRDGPQPAGLEPRPRGRWSSTLTTRLSRHPIVVVVVVVVVAAVAAAAAAAVVVVLVLVLVLMCSHSFSKIQIFVNTRPIVTASRKHL